VSFTQDRVLVCYSPVSYRSLLSESQRIVVQAHTPLGHGSPLLLENEVILSVSCQLDCSPAQVLIRWQGQQGVCVVVKFSSEEHAKEIQAAMMTNDMFLSPQQMKAIDEIGMSIDSHRFVCPQFMYRKLASWSW
jgi:diketogulonate reductase-like aldo/keto reductase